MKRKPNKFRIGLIAIVVGLVSAGWVVPLFWSIRFAVRWCQLEASPVVYGTERTVNSFPFLTASRDMAEIACIWAGVVSFAWSIFFVWRFMLVREKRQPVAQADSDDAAA